MEQPKQQMDLITEMINAARKNYNDNGSIYLLWGWLVCFASLTQYVLMQMHNEYNYIGWLTLMPLGMILQFIMMARRKKKENVKTHLDRVMAYVWGAFGISLALVLFSSEKLQMNTYPMVLMLYAIGTFISGGALRLRPMIWGAVSCWLIAIICFFVNFESQLLLLAIAVILAYIIPGYILMARNKQYV